MTGNNEANTGITPDCDINDRGLQNVAQCPIVCILVCIYVINVVC